MKITYRYYKPIQFWCEKAELSFFFFLERRMRISLVFFVEKVPTAIHRIVSYGRALSIVYKRLVGYLILE